MEFRAKHSTFGENDDEFDMFYSFVLDFNQQDNKQDYFTKTIFLMKNLAQVYFF